MPLQSPISQSPPRQPRQSHPRRYAETPYGPWNISFSERYSLLARASTRKRNVEYPLGHELQPPIQAEETLFFTRIIFPLESVKRSVAGPARCCLSDSIGFTSDNVENILTRQVPVNVLIFQGDMNDLDSWRNRRGLIFPHIGKFLSEEDQPRLSAPLEVVATVNDFRAAVCDGIDGQFAVGIQIALCYGNETFFR